MRLNSWMKMSLGALALGGLSSCSGTYQLPDGYNGGTAVIRSSTKQINAVKGESFKPYKIDGKFVPATTVATPRGGGIGLVMQEASVTVPTQPITLHVTGSTTYAADGVALADSMIGGNRYVAGDISFTPKAGGEYRVKGQLEKGSESVWLVDERTGKQVGQTIRK
jgi:hypothetical protein